MDRISLVSTNVSFYGSALTVVPHGDPLRGGPVNDGLGTNDRTALGDRHESTVSRGVVFGNSRQQQVLSSDSIQQRQYPAAVCGSSCQAAVYSTMASVQTALFSSGLREAFSSKQYLSAVPRRSI